MGTGGYFLKTPEKTRLELALLLQEHLEEFSYYATLWYDKYYPDLNVKQTSGFSERLEWSRSLVQWVSNGLENGGVLRDEVGFLVNIVGEPEFSEFVNEIVVQMNVLREIAPLIMQTCASNPTKAREYYDCLDEYLREYVVSKLDEFAEEVSAPRWFSRRWGVAVDEAIYAETLKHLGLKQYEDVSVEDGSENVMKKAQERLAEQRVDGLQHLSRRERQVLTMLLEGKSNGEISAVLGVSQNTVKTHVAHVFDKLNVNSRVELLRKVLGA
jgi:DNA-binding CsgD family transcriptional regulator